MDTLAYRLEYQNQGPFSSEDIFRAIRKSILKHGPDYDGYGTTFLNYYDQRSIQPMFVPSIKALLDRSNLKGELRFGFDSKEVMEESFGIDRDEERYNKNFLHQFQNFLNQDESVCIRVYLVKPLEKANNEVVYRYGDSELLAEAKTYQEFLQL